MPRSFSSSTSYFRNVDLEIYSKCELRPLLDRFGKKVIVLYAGRNRGMHCAHLELSRETTTADSTIRAFCKLIEALPEAELAAWNRATIRSFSVGIQAGSQPNPLDDVIHPQTIRAVAKLAGRIVFTIYAPEQSNESARAPKHPPLPLS